MLPSRFIKELPPEHVTLVQPNGAQTSTSFTPSASGKAYVIEGEYSDTSPPHHGFHPQDRVFHQKFGYGRIVAINGNQLEIEFDHTGIKKVISDFVEKE